MSEFTTRVDPERAAWKRYRDAVALEVATHQRQQGKGNGGNSDFYPMPDDIKTLGAYWLNLVAEKRGAQS